MKVRFSTHGIPREASRASSDAFAVRSWDQTIIAVLCDGAGSGAPAREAAMRTVASLVENYRVRPRTWGPQRALLEFTERLNRSFYTESQARFERSEMISTLVAIVIEGDRLFGISVGDSRAGLLRDGAVQILTVDHVDTVMTSMLTQAMGMTVEIEPHQFTLDIQAGDLLFLTSDGVSNNLKGDELLAALKSRFTAKNLVQTAREQANAETNDDMSAIVLDVVETGKLRAMNERSLPIPPTLKSGDRVDGYELLKHFQGTDRVWLADKEGHRVVMKFAPPEAIDNEKYLDAFTRETWNATRVQSEHFVRAHEPPGQTARYYMMEFIDAPSLYAVLRERLLSVDSAVALGAFLVNAGQALLRLDLAHGDIKPENILCIGDYAKLIFKLVDLGSAAALFSVSSRAGTASYLAPERFRGAPISECTEIFAIGVTLYQALTKKLPFGEIERFQTPSFSTPKRVVQLNPNVPPWLDAVIARAIAIDPERRYQHYSEMAFDLENPTKVQPYQINDGPLLERNPLAFYKTGFFLLLALCVWLLLRLMAK